jgi:hypothetical protein
MRRSPDKGNKSRGFGAFRRGLQNSRTPLPKVLWIGLGAIGVLLLALVAQSVRHQDALIAWRSSLEIGSVMSWPEWDPAWPLLQPPPNGTSADLRGPYAFAARNAETLRFIPCYCGCRREGHESALNCFVKGLTPQGLPIWNDHSFTCPLCVNIVGEVALMSSRGMSLPAMRQQIDEHHGRMFATSTSTPLPR